MSNQSFFCERKMGSTESMYPLIIREKNPDKSSGPFPHPLGMPTVIILVLTL